MPTTDPSDRLQPGLSITQRAQIDALKREILRLVIAQGVDDPMVVYTALLNCLGSLIGTVLVADAASLTQRTAQLLPLYVEAYRSQEKRILS